MKFLAPRTSSGFSVIEALFSLLIFAIVLSALAYSLGQLSRVSLSRQDFGTELEVLQLARLLRADSANAKSLTITDSSLTLVGQNPHLSLSQRMELGLDSMEASSTVVYEFREGWLFRSQSFLEGSETSPLSPLDSFSARREGNLALVSFAVNRINKVQSFDLKVVIP